MTQNLRSTYGAWRKELKYTKKFMADNRHICNRGSEMVSVDTTGRKILPAKSTDKDSKACLGLKCKKAKCNVVAFRAAANRQAFFFSSMCGHAPTHAPSHARACTDAHARAWVLEKSRGN